MINNELDFDLETIFIAEEDPTIAKSEKKINDMLESIKNIRREIAARQAKNREDQLRSVGMLAEKAKIALLDREILYGAFLSVAAAITTDAEQIKKWKQLGSLEMARQGAAVHE